MLDKIQLNEKEKKIRIIERKIDELKAQGKLYAEQYKQALSSLEEYGIKDPKDIKPTIISIKKEMEELEAERHAFKQPLCLGHDTFALFLYTERNEYGYAVSCPVLSRMVADAVYFRIHNQRMPGLKFYAGEQFFNSGGSMQGNTANSLGMVRIVYPEKQICEHIVFTLLEQVGWRLQNNQFMAGEGCADGTVPKDYRAMVLGLLDSWKLDEAYLTLDRLVDKPSEDTRFTYWNRLRGWTSYEEAKAENPNPLLFLDQRYETMYREQFRGHGVERYYNAESIFFRKCEIMKNVREDLYRRLHLGVLSGRVV